MRVTRVLARLVIRLFRLRLPSLCLWTTLLCATSIAQRETTTRFHFERLGRRQRDDGRACASAGTRATRAQPPQFGFGAGLGGRERVEDADEEIRNEMVSTFVERMRMIWQKAQAQLQKSIRMQGDYYNRKHRDIRYAVGDYVLLSTQNLRIKGVPQKLQRKFCGPFRVEQTIGTQAYRLQLPEDWSVHPVFHVSLLKQWRDSAVQVEDDPVELEEPDAPEFYETEKLLRWRWAKAPGRRGRRRYKEFLTMWRGYPLEEASWVPEYDFSDQQQLKVDIENDNPPEDTR